jgi:uncharacterized repeat protein (TIGR04052 family)
MTTSCLLSRLQALCSVGAVIGALGSMGCSAGENAEPELTLEFEARFGSEPFDCNGTIAELGSSGVSARPLDFRLFVHDVQLIRAGGERVPFKLLDDALWQRDGVALLDFEDGSGTCETGSRDTNFALHGSAPQHDDYEGVAFTLGVPEAMNHLDAATAPAPFNAPGLWWSWQGGYKYARVDVATDDHPGGFFFHLGGTNCGGSPSEGFSCQYPNLARIELEASGLSGIVVDAAKLFGEVDLAAQPDFETDFVPGCMAFSGDPECPAMFGALGLAFEGGEVDDSTQTTFEMR